MRLLYADLTAISMRCGGIGEEHFPSHEKNFLAEARKLAKFNHPNIVRVNRYFEAHDTAYFVMDHEAGGSLRSLLRSWPDTFTEGEIVGADSAVVQGDWPNCIT